jgi:hypothetical protein
VSSRADAKASVKAVARKISAIAFFVIICTGVGSLVERG